MLYSERIKKELNTYKEITDVHDLPESHNYMISNFVTPIMKKTFGFSSFPEMIEKYVNQIKTAKDESKINILSLGSGNCDTEIDLALTSSIKANIFCYELNSDMLERGKRLALEKLGKDNKFNFVQCDINKLKLQQEMDIVIANHSLHHFVELEHIFSEVSNNMTEKSYFVINDMIGRNGHMFWNNTLEIINLIWNMLPKELKYCHQWKKYHFIREQWDFSKDSFEGIRSQDILPLLDKTFKFKDFAPFWAITNRFIDRGYGHNFNLDNQHHKAILDMLGAYDDYFLSNKLLKPTQMLATVMKKDADISDYKFMYFETPYDAYTLDDDKVWDYFYRLPGGIKH